MKSIYQHAQEQFGRRDALRVLFLFDKEGDHQEEINDWQHEDIKCLRVDCPGLRTIYQIEKAYEGGKVLVYQASPRPRNLGTYALADLLIANAELTVKPEAELADRYSLQPEEAERLAFFYRTDFCHASVRDFLSPILQTGRFTKKAVERGLLAYHLDLFSALPSSFDHILAGVFILAQDDDRFDRFVKDCEERGLAEPLARRIARRFGLDSMHLDHDLVVLAAQKLKYNLLTQTLEAVRPEDPYAAKLAITDTQLLTQIRTLAQVWDSHADLVPGYVSVLEELASGVTEKELLDVYGADASYGYLTPGVKRSRLQHAAAILQARPSKSRQIAKALRGDDKAGRAAEVIWHIACFYQLRADHPDLTATDLDAAVRAYTEVHHRCDLHYRKAIRAYQVIQHRHPDDQELLADLVERFEAFYSRDFVHPMNTSWQKLLEEDPAKLRTLEARPLDTFFDTHVAGDPPKTAVVISDGLRYEAAAELATRMQQDDWKSVETGAMMAPMPSVTSLGKACLLPHETLTWKDQKIFADDLRTQSTRDRERVLQRVRSDIKALTFDDLIKHTTTTGRDLCKEYPILFVYHDRIDATGDKPDTEEDTPEAVERAIEEISSAIQKLNNFNVRRVLITADHGFLFSMDVHDSMQEDAPETSGTEWLRKNRCVVASEVKGTDGYRFPLREVSPIDEDGVVAVPRAVNRYLHRGAGKRYAHGGASLQELVVPVLEVKKASKDKAQKVDVRLVTNHRQINSGVLKVQVMQVSSLSKSTRARSLDIYLVDNEGERVSNKQRLTFESTSTDPTERIQDAILELSPEANAINTCRLVAYDPDETGQLNRVIDEHFTIQRLFEQDGF